MDRPGRRFDHRPLARKTQQGSTTGRKAVQVGTDRLRKD
jgi:hypothetical protein